MRLALLCCSLLLGGCMLGVETPTPTLPEATLTESAAASTPSADNALSPTDLPAPTITPDGWRPVLPGLEHRTLIPNGDALAQIDVFRIDPAAYRFEVHYRPGAPLTLADWTAQLSGAELIVNANFFDPDDNVVGLLISFGQVYGFSYTDRGGLFAVTDNVPSLRSNIYEPYQNGERIDHAAQAFPMLVLDGAQAYTFADDGDARRRTVIGMDEAGRVLVMVTPLAGMSLTAISAYLAESDLNLADAFALDGGGSTMMNVPAADFSLPSFDAVPAVIAVFANP